MYNKPILIFMALDRLPYYLRQLWLAKLLFRGKSANVDGAYYLLNVFSLFQRVLVLYVFLVASKQVFVVIGISLWLVFCNQNSPLHLF